MFFKKDNPMILTCPPPRKRTEHRGDSPTQGRPHPARCTVRNPPPPLGPVFLSDLCGGMWAGGSSLAEPSTTDCLPPGQDRGGPGAWAQAPSPIT